MKQITCQICKQSKPGMPGDQLLACGKCAERAVDSRGNAVRFNVEPFAHGITATHTTKNKHYTDSDIDCTIDSFPCVATELRFGGVGIKIVN